MIKKVFIILLAVVIFLSGIGTGMWIWAGKQIFQLEVNAPHYENSNEVFKAGLFDHLDAVYLVVENREYSMRLEGEKMTEFCEMLSSLELVSGSYELGKDEEGNVLYGVPHRFLMVYQSGATFEFLISRNYLMVSKTIMEYDSLQGRTYAYTPTDDKGLAPLPLISSMMNKM